MRTTEVYPYGKNSGVAWDSGIDWVTYIGRSDSAAAAVIKVANELAEERGSPVDKRSQFNVCGYQGWKQGAVRLGHRGRSALVQLSGETASECWTRLVPCGGQPTRLDVQTTAQPSTPQPRFGQRFLRPLTAQTRGSPLLRTQSGLWKDSTGSFLGTVGRRTNDRYLRVYDKGIELGTHPPGALWRTELEAKGRRAAVLWKQLQESSNVRQWCFDSLAASWKRSGYSWGLEGHSGSYELPTLGAEPVPDAERLIKWLQTSVRPAVGRLLKGYSREQVTAFIGLGPETETSDADTADA